MKKIVLKRRKHRNGIRPTRKGSLKTNLTILPTREEHSARMAELMAFREKHAPLDLAFEYLKAGDKFNFDKILKIFKFISDTIRAMQKGYDYFREHRQIDIMELSLQAINEVNPVFIGKSKSACSDCEHKNNCPFSAIPKYMLVHACSIISQAHSDRIIKAVRGEPTDMPLTQPEMAKLALAHLS